MSHVVRFAWRVHFAVSNHDRTPADVLLETLQSILLSAASPILAEDLGGAGRAKNVFAKCCRESS